MNSRELMLDDLQIKQDNHPEKKLTRDEYAIEGIYSRTEFEAEFGNYSNFYDAMIVYRANKEALKKNEENYNASLYKKVQKLNDTNRIERKEIREKIKFDNTLEELYKVVIEEIKKQELTKNNFTYTIPNNEEIAIVHLTDIHLNEKIDLGNYSENNVYDFNVARRKLEYYANYTIKACKDRGITHINICNTGDSINSSKRITELVNNILPVGKALCESFKILKDFVQLLADHFYVNYYTVVGNECRMESSFTNDNYYDTFHACNNYDYILHQFLKEFFNTSNVTIADQNEYKEYILKIFDKNFLLKHGEDLTNENAVDKVISKYAKTGTYITAILTGHIHSSSILSSDWCLRGGSVCGSNEYSFKNLNYASKSSQNLIFVAKNYHNVTSVDLTFIK
jgi:hypothetical protein